jgi:diguanylate cyclase (GGDEF)-like protein/PAS domain S-box-containing protein
MPGADSQKSQSGALHDAALQEQNNALKTQIRALRAEHIALQSECDFYRTIADYTYDWECWLSPDGTCLYSSPSCLKMTGYSAGEFQSNPTLMLQIVHPDDRARIEAYLNEFVLSEKNQEPSSGLQYRVIHRDGTITWISNASQPVFDSDGNYIGRRCSSRDITSAKAMELALRESEERYRVMFEKNQAVKMLIDPENGSIIDANPATVAFYGYDRAQLLQMKITDINILPAEEVRTEMQNARNEQRSYFLFRHRLASGEIRDVEVHSSPLEIGRRQLLYSIVHDITEQKRAEQELRASEARYRTLVQHFPDGVVLLFDNDTRFLVAGGRGLEVLGLSPQQMEGRLLREVVPPAVADIGEPLYRAVLDGTAPAEVEQYYGEQTYRTQAVSLRNDAGEIVAGMLISQDITARKQAEQNLQREMQHLEQRNHQMLLLKHMADRFLVCTSHREVYQVIRSTCRRLFDGQSGGLFIPEIGHSRLQQVVGWGDMLPDGSLINWEDCLALQDRHSHTATGRSGAHCRHNSEIADNDTLCVPLITQGETLGLLTLYSSKLHDKAEWQIWRQLAETVARQITMALSNLAMRSRLQRQALQDGLTGLYNRRYLDETLPRELQRAERRKQQLGLIMLDIDYFKAYNDTYGHDIGDLLLQAVGAFLMSSVRTEDIACRYGGEEFLLMLPGASQEEAQRRAEDIRHGIANLRVQAGKQSLGAVTVSLGVASFPRHGSNADELVHQADLALYRAKARGRNQVNLAEPVAEP